MVLLARVGTPLSPTSLLRGTSRATPILPVGAPLSSSLCPEVASLLHAQRRPLSSSASALPDLHTDRHPPLSSLAVSPRGSHTSQGLVRPQTNQISGRYSLDCLRILRRSFIRGTPGQAHCRHARTMPPATMGTQAEQAEERKELGEAEIAEIKRELQEKAKIILGSSSYSRQMILRDEMGLDFTILKANIDEKAIRFSDPSELVVALAKAKAEAIIGKLKAQESEGVNGPLASSDGRTPLLITSDQVVVYEGKIREKPESPDQAREFIRGYGLAPAGTVGSTMVTNLVTGAQKVAVDSTQTYFSPIPEESIEQLIKEGLVFYCAGALLVEHPLVAPLVIKMEGTVDAVMGLPKQSTWLLLRDVLHS